MRKNKSQDRTKRLEQKLARKRNKATQLRKARETRAKQALIKAALTKKDSTDE